VTDTARPGNVIDIPNNPGNHQGAQHAAAFPVALPAFFLKAFSDPGDTWYEPFSGSGTTIIAAEMAGRACHAIELNPAYVDVAIRRWQDFTGETAVLEGTGATFADVAAERGVPCPAEVSSPRSSTDLALSLPENDLPPLSAREEA